MLLKEIKQGIKTPKMEIDLIRNRLTRAKEHAKAGGEK